MAPTFLVTRIISGDTVAVGSPAQIPLFVVCSNLAATGSTFSFNPGDNPASVLGPGLGADVIAYALRDSGQTCAAVVAAPTWTSPPTLTHLDATGGNSPTGPTVTIALGAGIPGNLDDHNFVLRVRTGGALGTAIGGIAYDGGPDVEVFNLPVQGPAQLTGTAAITPTTLATANGLTLVLSAPGAATLTFPAGSLGAVAAGLHGATATVAAPVTLLASSLLAAGKTAIAANARRIRFTTAGLTPSDAPANVVITGTDYTGATQIETLNLSQTAGSVSSVNAYATIVSFAYPSADGTGATIAIGYEDAYASAAELAAEVTALAVAVPVAVVGSISQTALGSFLTIATTAVSSSATLTFNASPGTGAALLGFTANETATGTDATYPLPRSGHVLTFPTGSYVVGESYTDALVGPRASIAAIVNAVTAALATFSTIPFGFVVVPQPADTAADCKALVDALESQRAAALLATVPRAYYCVVGGPWHTPSTSATTNQANITTNDGLLLAAFASAAANPNSVAHDDVYIPGSALGAPGDFRRSASVAMAVKRASAARVAATVAEGTVPEASLTAGDGLTLARDQNTATVHLEGEQGPGFFCLKKADDSGAVKFALGATRAGASSRLQNDGDFAVCTNTAFLAWQVVKPWEGQRPGLDPLTGQMADHEKQSRAGQVDTAIRPFLLPDPGGDATATPLVNCTDFGVQVLNPPTGLFQNNGITPVVVTITTLGLIQQVILTIAATGVSIQVAPAGA